MYGIKVGKPNYEKNSQLKTQEHLASDMGMDVRTLQNYKMLADRTPKVSDLNQEQLDILSCTGTVITLYGENYNRLSSFTTKTIKGKRSS